MLARSIRQGGVAAYRWYSAHELAKFLHLIVLLLFIREGRVFVNCEGDEDFDYLLKHLGEDGLMCSSDFPHGDPSAEETYVSRWRARTDLPDKVKNKLLGENAARFFAL